MGIFDRLFKPNVKMLQKMKYVKGLIKALRYKDWSVRREAAEALGEIGDLRAIKPLYEIIMSDRDKDVRERAAEALGKLADKYGFTPMGLALQEAAEGLSRFAEGKFKTVEQLIHALQNDSNPFVQMGAAIDLGLHGDPKAIEPLRYAIQHDPDPAVREAAKEALEKIKSKNLK